jgi:carbamoyl-phosphate synthase large subunit
MRSTGEVMGHASNFGHAFAKAQMATKSPLPDSGTVCISVNDMDKATVTRIARHLHRMGFKIIATRGTCDWLNRFGVPATHIYKIGEGSPNILDALENGQIQLMINTPLGGQAHEDGAAIRSMCYQVDVPIITTTSAAMASMEGIKRRREKPLKVRSLQDHHKVNGLKL